MDWKLPAPWKYNDLWSERLIKFIIITSVNGLYDKFRSILLNSDVVTRRLFKTYCCCSYHGSQIWTFVELNMWEYLHSCANSLLFIIRYTSLSAPPLLYKPDISITSWWTRSGLSQTACQVKIYQSTCGLWMLTFVTHRCQSMQYVGSWETWYGPGGELIYFLH